MAALTEFEEGSVMRTLDTCYTGIQALLYTPTAYGVGEVTEGTKGCYYFNFYLGFDDELEAGISHTRKYTPDMSPNWRKFSYSQKVLDQNFPLVPVLAVHNLKIVVDQAAMTSYVLDGNLVTRVKIPKPQGAVKMCFATCDTNVGDKHQVWYDNAAFELKGIRTKAGQLNPGDPKGWLSPAECERLGWERRWRPPKARLPRIMTTWGVQRFRSCVLAPGLFVAK
jgi:hypothetical protein